MRLLTLGDLRLENSAFKRAKPLLLLAYLALEGPKERRFLRELLWRDAKDSRNSLGTALGRLRGVDAGVVGSDEIRAWCETQCDATQLLAAADDSDNERVVELYRGPFLEGVDPSAAGIEIEEWIYSTREALGTRVRQALLNLGEDHAGVGEFSLGAELAQRAYSLPGAPESVPDELERLFVLLKAGDHPEAAEVRKEAAGFDLELSRSVEDARGALHEDKVPTTRKVRHNLPAQATRFVGREAEKTEIGEMLRDPDCRLLTITGPGGIGKTRLAIEVATSQLRRFPDGVFFVPFAPVTSSTAMPFAIADALGLSAGGQTDVAEQLFSNLEDKNLLLVLDNLAHLLAGTDLIHDLWERTQNVKLLITSRERLNLQAEQLFVLSGLSSPAGVPVEQSDAVRLFLQAARSGGHDVTLSESTTPAVTRICELVDGMPLALELAASWLKALTLEEIATEITTGIDVLQASTRDVPERHRSIRAVFDSSWKLLTDNEREVLGNLSEFRGGFRRDAASVVAGASLFTLGSLVDKSFLTFTAGGRYEQHPLVREYARERLAEQPQEQALTREKHGRHYLSFLWEHYPELSSSRVKEARKLLAAELPNILTAWDWAVDNLNLEQVKDAVFPLHKLFEVDGREQEGVALFSLAAGCLDEGSPEHRAALGYILIGQAAVHRALGDYRAEARSLLERGLGLLRPLDEDLGVAWGLSWLTLIRGEAGGDVAQGRALLQEGFPIARRVGSAHLIGRFLNQAVILEDPASGGSVEDARKLREQILSEQREVGDPNHLSHAMAKLGEFLFHHRLFDEGKALLKESLELARESGSAAEVTPLQRLTRAALMSGDLDEAEGYASELLQISKDNWFILVESDALMLLGVIATRRGHIREAEVFLVEALQIASRIETMVTSLGVLVAAAGLRVAQGQVAEPLAWLGFSIDHPAADQFSRFEAQRLLDGFHDQLPPAEFTAAVERGKESSLEEMFSEILSGR